MNLSRDDWTALMRRMSIPDDGTTFDRLRDYYSETHRKYHNSTHIIDCLQQWRVCEVAASHPDEVELALWFHDAIYDLRANDNELKSAQMAGEFLRQQNSVESTVARVEANIVATMHQASPDKLDQQIVVDVDLSILGRAAAEYDQFEDRIRDEYSWVPHDVFCQKRSEILQSFLDRDRIYSTPWFTDRYESQARNNLARAIATLGE
jgi:predicted metal-dependent HD superfamily phosphohydrolase